MVDDEERATIARQEADDTFQSITDLDGISDTAIVAVTFFLAAVSTWTGFVFSRLEPSTPVGVAVLVVVLSSVVATAAGVLYLLRALFPRRFYGPDVGTAFGGRPARPWRTADDSGADWFRAVATDDPDEASLDGAFDEWLEEYAGGVDVGTPEEFQLSRFFNYKAVARIKARNVAYGLAWFRLAVLLFLLLVVLTVVGLLL